MEHANHVGEEELRKLSMEMRYLEQTADALQQRLNMINAAISDLNFATSTLDGIEKEKENTELLVPVGGSAYLKVKLADTDKVIVGLGAGVSVEKTLQEAKITLKERLDELEKTMESGKQQYAQIAQRMNADRARVETLLSNEKEGTS